MLLFAISNIRYFALFARSDLGVACVMVIVEAVVTACSTTFSSCCYFRLGGCDFWSGNSCQSFAGHGGEPPCVDAACEVVITVLHWTHWSARLLRRVTRCSVGASWDPTTRKVEGSGIYSTQHSTSSRPRILLRAPLSDQRRTATLNLHGTFARTGNVVIALLMHWRRWTRAIPADRLHAISPSRTIPSSQIRRADGAFRQWLA